MNGMYDYGRQGFLEADIDWMSDTIKSVLVDTGAYSVNLATHQYLSDIPIGARIATVTLTGKTATAGVADATNLTFPTVSGPTIEAMVLYKDTGSPATSRLILYVDTASGLPITPNGGDVNTAWDDGSEKIFQL